MESLDVNPQDQETARLEALDDLIFPAIDGDQAALEASTQVWRETVAALGKEKVEESRHEYLRYARATWKALRHQATKDPLRLIAVVKIILMLLGDNA